MCYGLARRLISCAILPCVLLFSLGAASPDTDDVKRNNLRNVQDIVDDLKVRLAIPVEVTATFVPTNELLVSVEPGADRRSPFVMSFQESFLEGLNEEELRAIVAHELGHVWIFTHHPYLQTERLANDVAMRVVSRESLEKVYGKVWAHGAKAELARVLPK